MRGFLLAASFNRMSETSGEVPLVFCPALPCRRRRLAAAEKSVRLE